ncbi:MAG: hypothetical protein GY870_19060, partial [archaeon]|nr:hypothetical protein [archaeon]
LFNIWLPNSQYEQIYPYIIECYDAKRFLGLENNKSEIDWYIPIEEINDDRSTKEVKFK